MMLAILLLNYLFTTPLEAASSDHCCIDLTTAPARSAATDSLPNGRWVQVFNEGIDGLPDMYVDKAILLESNGKWWGKADQRMAYWKKLKEKVGKIASFRSVYKVTVEQGLIFETGSFIDQAGRDYQQFIIWRKVGEKTLKELEIIVESFINAGDAAGLSKARGEWMKYCNSHDVEGLVGRLYVEDALYYNQRRLTQGREAIVEQYKYMRDTAYRLTLIPQLLQPVSDSLIFELGRCEGSYRGPYALIWTRRNGNNWQIMFDSN